MERIGLQEWRVNHERGRDSKRCDIHLLSYRLITEQCEKFLAGHRKDPKFEDPSPRKCSFYMNEGSLIKKVRQRWQYCRQ